MPKRNARLKRPRIEYDQRMRCKSSVQGTSESHFRDTPAVFVVIPLAAVSRLCSAPSPTLRQHSESVVFRYCRKKCYERCLCRSSQLAVSCLMDARRRRRSSPSSSFFSSSSADPSCAWNEKESVILLFRNFVSASFSRCTRRPPEWWKYRAPAGARNSVRPLGKD